MRQSRHVADLLREAVRLTAHVADIELGETPADMRRRSIAPRPPDPPPRIETCWPMPIELDIHAFQARLAERFATRASRANGPPFEPSELLGYRSSRPTSGVVVHSRARRRDGDREPRRRRAPSSWAGGRLALPAGRRRHLRRPPPASTPRRSPSSSTCASGARSTCWCPARRVVARPLRGLRRHLRRALPPLANARVRALRARRRQP